MCVWDLCGIDMTLLTLALLITWGITIFNHTIHQQLQIEFQIIFSHLKVDEELKINFHQSLYVPSNFAFDV